MWFLGMATSVLIVLAVGSWAIVAAATRPVGVGAIDTFTDRQRLHLPDIVHDICVRQYLSTTRRWRAGGLVVAFVFAFGMGIRAGRISIDLGAAFLGWFAGALIAEWRLNVHRNTARRTAFLTRRRLRRYLGVPVMAVVCLAVGALAVMAGYALVHGPVSPTVAVLVGSLAPVAVAGVTARHILLRPAADAAPGVDDALRSRSLHALSGAVTAYTVSGVAGLVLMSSQLNPSGSQLIPFAILVGGAAIGGLIGVARGPMA
jgi:hypothetical protein